MKHKTHPTEFNDKATLEASRGAGQSAGSLPNSEGEQRGMDGCVEGTAGGSRSFVRNPGLNSSTLLFFT